MNCHNDWIDYLAGLPLEELRERQEIASQDYSRLSRMCLPNETLERSQAYQDALSAAVDRVAFEEDDQQ